MNDRELLELAAKAAGIVYNESFGKGMWVGEFYSGKEWNPLNDDGDALRLAVKLQINVEWWVSMPDGIAGKLTFDGNGVILMSNVQDKAAMLRKCITRAAAEIARAADAGGKEG